MNTETITVLLSILAVVVFIYFMFPKPEVKKNDDGT